VTGCLDVLANHGFLDCLHAVRARHAPQTASPPHIASDSHGGERFFRSAAYFTTPAAEPRVRVDYCFVRGKGVQVDQVRVLEDALSDHRALVVDLSFSRPSPPRS
jgi:endonuclease/exonuclease/phosphatase family metal-dependent hydrolase